MITSCRRANSGKRSVTCISLFVLPVALFFIYQSSRPIGVAIVLNRMSNQQSS